MPKPSSDLGLAVRSRRRALGMDSRAILSLRSGVSERTIGSIERDGHMPSGQVQADLERALRWDLGTMQLIRDGHAPPDTIPAPADPAREVAALASELRAALDHLDRVRADVERLLDRLPDDG